MDKNLRGRVFNTWLADLQKLVISYIGVKKSKMNEIVEKEMYNLLDRRDKAIEELRSEVYTATNHNVLLVRPNKFPWIDSFIKAAEDVIRKNPGGADYLIPVAEEFHALSAGQIILAQKAKNKLAEGEWLKKVNQYTELLRKLRKAAQVRSDISSSGNYEADSSNAIFSSDTKYTEEFNQKYFRTSCLRALNIRSFNDLIIKISHKDPLQVVVPKELMNSPLNTIINYYSILREATNLTEGAGCGTVGMMKLPYPIAYNFLSAGYQKKLSYEEYLKSFKAISHINLIKVVKNNMENVQNKKQYYIELETISPPGSFEYSFGILDIIKEDGQYKINNIETALEDYFCAPYHFWQHNAEMKVDIVYGNWSKLLASRYPTIQSEYKKYIYIKGTDGNNYLFVFIKLTNGTDVEIGQYKQSDSGQWLPVNLNIKNQPRANTDFSGTWASTMGVLVMKQEGISVTGIYPAVKPQGWGAEMKGKIEGTVSGNILTGSWSESRYPGQFASGKFRFRLLTDRNHFLGTRGEGNSFEGGKWGGPWDGHRIK